MKILVISNMFPSEKHPSYGIFVKRFCNQLERIGINYTVCAMRKADSKIGKLVNYICFYVKTFFMTLVGKYDSVYVHYPSFSGVAVNLVCKMKRITLYTNLHGSDVIPENLFHEKMQKYTIALLKRSEKVIVPSAYFKNLVVQKYGVAIEKIFIYPSGGIDNRIFNKKSNEEVNKFSEINGFDLKKQTIGMAGRITKDKGWDTFVDAVSRIDIDVNCVIVGDGDEAPKLQSAIDKTSNSIIWIKKLLPQEELAVFYSACDYFVFPTKRAGESLGLVAVEAMACGTPVIASDYAAPKDYVEHGVNGFKFKVGSPEDLARVIREAFLYINTEKRRLLEEGAYKSSEKFFCENLDEQFKEIFK